MKRVAIEEALKEKGIKKKHAAQMLGISETYFNAYIGKPDSISLKNALIICEMTGKKMDEIDFGIKNDFFKPKLQFN